MNNLSLSLLGLVLIYIPACFSKQCFSEPSYPCCTGNKIVYTDKSGNWGVENGKWCGIDDSSSDSCFSVAIGYPCCSGKKVVYTDKSGNWGVENGEWCGIASDPTDSCFSVAHGYSCCESCEVLYTDKLGKWGVEDGNWCGIKDTCANPEQIDTDFDFSFLKLENNKKNMLYSPLSIKYALNMLQEGAVNNTYTEINKVIGNTELPKYSNIEKILSFANGLFIRDTYYGKVKSEYTNTLKAKYDAEVIKDEFKSADNANKWIENKTLGIIKDMLKDEVVKNIYTVMILINALAIDMEWVKKFGDDKTYGDKFYMDNGKEMKATMMSMTEVSSNNIAYYKDDDITVLTMDLREYYGTQFEFMAIMPKENLSAYIENVSKEQINEIDKKLKLSSDEEYGVNVRIPKFKFSYDLKLKDDLKELGIKDAFDEKDANFSKMAEINSLDENIFVGDALHKADIEFTEKGVKAAAVTVIIMMGGSGLIREKYPVDIVINRPFMFIIRDKNTKDIWFTGTVYEPNSWENDRDLYFPDYY